MARPQHLRRYWLDVWLMSATNIALPAALMVLTIKRIRTHRRRQREKAAEPQPSLPATAAKPKPRRDYKLKRDEDGSSLRQRQAGAGLQHDDVMELYNEDEVDDLHQSLPTQAAQGPAGGPAAPGQGMDFIKKLQSLGYRLVMAKDGSGQMFLVPPDAEGQDPTLAEQGGPGAAAAPAAPGGLHPGPGSPGWAGTGAPLHESPGTDTPGDPHSLAWEGRAGAGGPEGSRGQPGVGPVVPNHEGAGGHLGQLHQAPLALQSAAAQMVDQQGGDQQGGGQQGGGQQGGGQQGGGQQGGGQQGGGQQSRQGVSGSGLEDQTHTLPGLQQLEVGVVADGVSLPHSQPAEGRLSHMGSAGGAVREARQGMQDSASQSVQPSQAGRASGSWLIGRRPSSHLSSDLQPLQQQQIAPPTATAYAAHSLPAAAYHTINNPYYSGSRTGDAVGAGHSSAGRVPGLPSMHWPGAQQEEEENDGGSSGSGSEWEEASYEEELQHEMAAAYQQMQQQAAARVGERPGALSAAAAAAALPWMSEGYAAGGLLPDSWQGYESGSDQSSHSHASWGATHPYAPNGYAYPSHNQQQQQQQQEWPHAYHGQHPDMAHAQQMMAMLESAGLYPGMQGMEGSMQDMEQAMQDMGGAMGDWWPQGSDPVPPAPGEAGQEAMWGRYLSPASQGGDPLFDLDVDFDYELDDEDFHAMAEEDFYAMAEAMAPDLYPDLAAVPPGWPADPQLGLGSSLDYEPAWYGEDGLLGQGVEEGDEEGYDEDEEEEA